MSLADREEIPKRTMVLFFVIDTSSNMAGSGIGTVNNAIREVLPEIEGISDRAGAQIEIAVLEFSSGAHWITANGPVEAGRFKWNDLDTGGTSDFGAMCRALNDKLSTKAFMKERSESFAPTILLFMGSKPTDDWENTLAELKQNNWFKRANKAAFAIGDDADRDILKKFTGNMEMVLETHYLVKLKLFIVGSNIHGIRAPQTVKELPIWDTFAEQKPENDKLNNNLLNVIKEIVAKNGEAVLSDPKRISAFFKDLAKDEPKPQKNALVKSLECGFARILKNACESERDNCKQGLAKRLHEEEGLDLDLCVKTLELLAAVLFGEEEIII